MSLNTIPAGSRFAPLLERDARPAVQTAVLWEVRHASLRSVNWIVKRSIDVVLSAMGIVLLAPLFALVAIAIKLGSPGPVIFRQRRVGLFGREFDMYKFRSMIHDAEDRKSDVMHLNEVKDGRIFKITHDPRITPLGRFLRKASLDELPQLFNVLMGQMSLVGPRALPVREVQLDRPDERARLSVMPGVSGLWQVSGRSKLGFREMVDLDLSYIHNWSHLLDIWILSKTVVVVLKMEGSC